MTPASPDDAPAPPLTAIQLLSADDVCELWQVKKSWLYDAVESGILPAIKLGNHLRFRASDLAACLTDLATASPAGRSSRGPRTAAPSRPPSQRP